MGCGHEFHMKCLVQWLQKPDGTGSCPCCRREPGEMERLVSPVEDEEYEDDNESVESDDVSVSQHPSATPLMIAARQRKVEEVRRLIAEGAPVDAKDEDGDTALQWAEDDECRKVLLDAGADSTLLRSSWQNPTVPRTKHTALIAACEQDCLVCVKALLDAGANPNFADPDTGITPLMETIRSETSIAITDLLLNRGADVFQTDKMDWNSFMWFADIQGDVTVMALLLKAAGNSFNPLSLASIKKIQAVWRGYSMRRQHEAAQALIRLLC